MYFTGTLRIKNALDREKRETYTLNITATDQGLPPRSVSTAISVIVEDANDNPPQFSQAVYQHKITENNPNTATYLLALTASDKDKGIVTKTFRKFVLFL